MNKKFMSFQYMEWPLLSPIKLVSLVLQEHVLQFLSTIINATVFE